VEQNHAQKLASSMVLWRRPKAAIPINCVYPFPLLLPPSPLYNTTYMDGSNTQAGHEAGGWYHGAVTGPVSAERAAEAQPAAQPHAEVVEWTASEFVAHDKGFGWFMLLALFTIAVVGLVYWLTRDIFSVVVVVMMAVILGMAAARKPKVVSYKLDRTGLTAGKRYYPYSEYKSFAMPDDGPFTSVVLVPMKRFSFPASAYLAPDSQAKAVQLLSEHLPLEHGELDSLERLMRRLHF
jgi:hypothetical protein